MRKLNLTVKYFSTKVLFSVELEIYMIAVKFCVEFYFVQKFLVQFLVLCERRGFLCNLKLKD